MENIDNEDPLGKISRQLSEMGPAPPMAVGNDGLASPGLLGDQQRQFDGIAMPGVRHNPLTNLYTWNPMDLPDRKLSPQQGNYNLQDPLPAPDFRNFAPSPGSTRSESSYFASQRCPDHGGSGGRSRHGSSDHMGFDHHPSFSPHQMSGPTFQRETPLPGAHHTSLPGDHMGSFSTLSHLSTSSGGPLLQPETSPVNLHQVRTYSHSISHDGMAGMTPGTVPPDRAAHSPPLFDPSTPPPLFLVQRQHSDTFASAARSVPSPSSPGTEGEIFLHSQRSKPKLSLDLGTNIEGPSVNFGDLANRCTDSEESLLLYYKAAMDKWDRPETAAGLTKMDENDSHMSPKKQATTPEVSGADKSRPSYSDIAKTPKSASLPAAFRMDTQGSETTVKPAATSGAQKKDSKAFRMPIKRTSSGSKFLPRGSSSDHTKGSTPSRYGLDSFSEHSGITLSSSSESLHNNTRSRRDSCSSAGSSVSALDDITLATSYAPETPTPGKGKSADHKVSPTRAADSPKTPKSPAGAAPKSPPVAKEHVFFDPKRIFQPRNSTKTQAPSVTPLKANVNPGAASGTLLNNGKPTAVGVSPKLSSSAKQHDYINNDLRDASKLTNKTAEEIAHSGSSSAGKPSDGNPKYEKELRSGKRSTHRTNGTSKKEKRKQSESGQRQSEGETGPHHQHDRRSLLLENLNTGRLEEWMALAWEKLSYWGNIFIVWLLNFLIYGLGLVLFLVTSAFHLVLLMFSKGWTLVKEKLLKGRFTSKEGNRWFNRDRPRHRVGVEENIVLPATGEEAMKRLLACKGKDPYSILGLRADSSDEEIKKYYRKQAVLVHPDKNQEPGAEEAFKILGHAFEMIGEPGKRKQYDSHTQEELEADAMREFADMLTKLQTKIQEAANIMRCDMCGGKHRRVPVNRPFYSARFCQSCNMHHQAKEGDVWAESTMLGFYWHYYALMEGHVFDITEWMKCHRECFKHMKANAHGVMYRIATEGNKKNKHHPPGDANLEDFINRLFKSSAAAGAGGGDGDPRRAWGQPAWASPPAGSTGGAAAASAAGKKSGRRRKRR